MSYWSSTTHLYTSNSMHVYVVKTHNNLLLCYHVSVSNTVTNPGSKRQEPVVTRALIDLFRRRLWRSRTTIPCTHQSINCYRSYCTPHLNPKCCDRTFVKNSKNKVKRYRGTYLTDDWRRILNHFAEFVDDAMKGSILFFLPFAKCGDFLCRLFERLVHALILRRKFEL